MADASKPPPGAKKPAVNLQIKLPCATREELRARYGPELAESRLFVRTRAPKPVETFIRFDFRLADGTTVLRGLAAVAAVTTEAENPARPGMMLSFRGLDPDSHALLRDLGMPSPLPVLKPAPMATAPPPFAAPVPPARQEAPPRSPVPPAPEVAATPLVEPAEDTKDAPSPPPVEPSAVAPAAVAPAPGPVAAAPAGEPAPSLELLPEPVPEPAKAAEPAARRAVPRKGPVVGIDLGTTNSCVAWVHHGKPVIIPSREGYNTVPSVVAVNDKGRVLVGAPAKSQLLTNPRNTVYGAKRLIGRAFHSPAVTQLRERFPYEIVEGPRGEAAVLLAGKVHSLQELSALILKEVREVARGKLGQDVTRAVITVPAHYNDHQRQAVREAGDLAGLYVEQIINEPTAAALAFGHGRQLEKRVLVYDLGGGTFDVSVLELHGGNVYEVISTGGDTFLGGVDFDLKLLELLLAKFEKACGVPFDGDRVALQRLLDAAERAKIALSEANSHHALVPFVMMQGDKPLNLDAHVSREEYEQATMHLVERTLQVAAEVLAAKNLKPTDIDEVLLVGGQSRMPLVRDRLKAFFGKEPHKGVHPDEAVALGAALLAHSIATDQIDAVVLIDVLPMSIGVGLPGGRFKRIIDRNTALPHTRSHTIATTKDDQTSLEVAIFQGESDRAVENEYLGAVKLDGLPKAPRGSVKVDLTFKLSREALLTVVTREAETGHERAVTLATRDTPEQVRQKLADLEPPPPPKEGLWGRVKGWFGGRAA